MEQMDSIGFFTKLWLRERFGRIQVNFFDEILCYLALRQLYFIVVQGSFLRKNYFETQN